jgi:hypothetical protein
VAVAVAVQPGEDRLGIALGTPTGIPVGRAIPLHANGFVLGDEGNLSLAVATASSLAATRGGVCVIEFGEYLSLLPILGAWDAPRIREDMLAALLTASKNRVIEGMCFRDYLDATLLRTAPEVLATPTPVVPP